MSRLPPCSLWLLAWSCTAVLGCGDPPSSVDDGGTAGTTAVSSTEEADETNGACAEPLLSCAGACVDPQHDPAHCGGCDQACSDGLACIAGACDVACGPGLLTCAGACVDSQHDPAHCGGCDQPCAPEAVCQAGTCVASCEPPEVDCAGSCRNVDNDEQHCGGCDAPCPAGQPCVGGQCVAASLHHVLITGQSLSQGALSEVVSIEQPFDNVSFVTGVRAGGVGLDSLVPLVETSDGGIHGETLASGLANLMSERAIAAGREHRSLLSAHGVSGQPYAALQKGTAPYANGMAQVAAGLALAQAQGDVHAIRAVVVIHGESDHLGGNITYDEDLLQWQSDYEADVQAMTGQTLPVPLVTDQMSSFTAYGASASVIPLLQLRASRDEPERIVLMGPKYVQSYVPDGVHLSGEGERWLGEMHAKVLERILVDGEPWHPVSPRELTRDGAELTLRLWVPAPPLVLDDVTVSDPGNHGFGYTDDSGAPPTITAVTLMGEDTVRITLSAAPVGGSRRLTYAMNGIPGQPAGPMTGARGTLRDSDATQSRHGYALHNWCVHFDEPVP
ncbi:MXAN_6577-like cysteine-rich protein [Paraliomyxa miuraensis]|uniref:MXAN_6577-like cysteine-rich protein n=1 Tax=Paraliomyxa miuraensis TaxID=376150 RepID=UPI00224E480F|nr:MXAN_6577-like cysteine-rich protein [Paraliomyxa miuraensis]MCX4244315.1 hypothetical protein [Paraliomyxa miuraensis]